MPFIVKNMDIPKSCKQCIERGLRSAFRCLEWRDVAIENFNLFRAENCPLAKVEEPDWNYCAEKLPDNHEEVLVCMDDYESITVGNYMPFEKAWLVDFTDDLCHDVAAWMPAPQPPKAYKGKSDVRREDNESYGKFND